MLLEALLDFFNIALSVYAQDKLSKNFNWVWWYMPVTRLFGKLG